ncbi:hypothetical protein [Corynebacterium urealyticum]|uniref:hypothetical protein n=1 Tax=Corynebacterium urealyticum TaxID=43771 RepID=UPI0011E68141|nr:hypothetical protein [Corynebacterium urealyticum]TYR15874.1 hypothetical protein FYJ89_04995 [Corynebacterium urealyticum]
MKKTIIALAAASSVALSHGVAVADEGPAPTPVTKEADQKAGGSSNQDNKENQAPEKDTEDKKATGSSINDFFGWDETTSGWTKFQNIAAAIAGVVALVGSLSALFANIEKIVKQFTK